MNNKGNINNSRKRSPRRSPRNNSKYGLLFLTAALILVIVFCSIILFSLESNDPNVIDPSTETTTSDTNDTQDIGTDTPSVTLEPPVVAPVFDFEFPDDLHSRNAILLDMSDGSVIAAKNSSATTFPASITKMMTVIVAIEKIADPYSTTTVLSQEMFEYLYRENASVAGFSPGESVLAIDLMYASMLPSGADGSIGLAVLVAGSEAAYVELMNKKAEELGMSSTKFMNATGLHDINHYTTLDDMAKLITYAMKNELFRQIITTQRYSTSPTNLHAAGITFYSTVNTYISATGLTNNYIIGGKTGYTSEAGLCLASIAVIDGKEYALITTGAGAGANDVKLNAIDAIKVYESFADSLSESQI